MGNDVEQSNNVPEHVPTSHIQCVLLSPNLFVALPV
jgi:hypothetical protein